MSRQAETKPTEEQIALGKKLGILFGEEMTEEEDDSFRRGKLVTDAKVAGGVLGDGDAAKIFVAEAKRLARKGSPEQVREALQGVNKHTLSEGS